VGYDLSPALRAYCTCDKSTRDTRQSQPVAQTLVTIYAPRVRWKP